MDGGEQRRIDEDKLSSCKVSIFLTKNWRALDAEERQLKNILVDECGAIHPQECVPTQLHRISCATVVPF